MAHNGPENKSDKRRTIVSFNLRGKVDKVKKSLWHGDPMIYVRDSYAASTPEDAKTNDPYAFKL